MDLTNRVVIIAGALLWMFVLLVIVLLAWGAPTVSIERLADLAGYLEDHNNREAKLIVTFGGLILMLLAAVIIILELSPPEGSSVRVQKVGAGEARIGTDEIAQRVTGEVRALPHVNDARVTVVGRGERAEVNLELHVGPDADLSATADEACRQARAIIEGQMGVELARPPQARLHYRELRVARPEAASSVTAAPEPEAPAAAPEPPPAGFTGWERLPASEPPPEEPQPTSSTAHEATETPQEERPTGA